MIILQKLINVLLNLSNGIFICGIMAENNFDNLEHFSLINAIPKVEDDKLINLIKIEPV